MLKPVYITKTAVFFPNEPVSNNDMEDYLGEINGMRSRAKTVVLRSNGIKSRYYAIAKDGTLTHTNVEITVEAIKQLTDSNFTLDDIELLASGTASPDYLMPSHANMVHGELNIKPMDAMSASGSCNSAMWAFNYAVMNIETGRSRNAVCTGSERISPWMMANNFNAESKHLEAMGKNPYVAFEKDFLRWMLSDGAGAVLLRDEPAKDSLSLKVDWVEIRSYANEAEACMYSGGVKDSRGKLIPWRNFPSEEWLSKSIFSLKQDAKVLEIHIAKHGAEFLKDLIAKRGLKPEKVDYFLPHISSEFFRSKIKERFVEVGFDLPDEKWRTNLHKFGNIGSASAFVMLHELMNSGELKKGETIVMVVPESARFSYTFVHLTVE